MTPQHPDLEWHWKSFAELSTRELYALLQLRAEIFVVEQACAYQDLDGPTGSMESRVGAIIPDK